MYLIYKKKLKVVLAWVSRKFQEHPVQYNYQWPADFFRQIL